MRYFASSVFENIDRQITHETANNGKEGKVLIMIPSLPASVAVGIARRLESRSVSGHAQFDMLIKMARGQCSSWESDNPELYREAKKKEWVDERGTLTAYRNQNNNPGRWLVIVLMGTDTVMDRSSLADFYQCDIDTVWNIEMGKSFKKWSQQLLEDNSIAFEKETPERFDKILIPLYERGLCDLIQISSLLENIAFSGAQDGNDAEMLLLKSFDMFDLPCFVGYRYSGSKSFGQYLDKAVDFFSYDRYLSERAVKKDTEKVDAYREHNKCDLDEKIEEEYYSSGYNSVEEMLEGLKNYIFSSDHKNREKLRKCDFITIHDAILGFRTEKKSSTPKPKKLSGSPVEVVLTSLWMSLLGVKKEMQGSGSYVSDMLAKISIGSILFKHDCDISPEDGPLQGAAEREQFAIDYLARLIGGVDEWLEQHIQISAQPMGSEVIEVEGNLLNGNLDYRYSSNAEPYLEFEVQLIDQNQAPLCKDSYRWSLPEIQSYRIAQDTLQWAYGLISESTDFCLPVYYLPHFEELMLSTDADDTKRVLQKCLGREDSGHINLLRLEAGEKSSPLMQQLEKLAHNYEQFLQTACNEGLHTALRKGWKNLRHSYEKAGKTCLEAPNCGRNPLTSIFYRSFLVVREQEHRRFKEWIANAAESSAIVTILHPALLEMIEAQIQYLFISFNSLAEDLLQKSKRKLNNAVWGSYIDLARIHRPLTGVIKNRQNVVETETSGEELIHKIGRPENPEATLTTRLLLHYDAPDEEESDTSLFRQNRESLLIARFLEEYYKIHPHAHDGLCLAAYQDKDIQPLIAAVHAYLKGVCNDRNAVDDDRYTLDIVLFTESSDDTVASNWIEQWKERWEEAETKPSLAHYRKSRISIAHRVVSPKHDYRQFLRLINKDFEVDVFLMNSFLHASTEGEFAQVDKYDLTSKTVKFPVLEKPFSTIQAYGHSLKRSQILNNRQFRVSFWQTEAMARLNKRDLNNSECQHVLLGHGDYAPWQGLIDRLHKKSDWVICIDPNIDEQLIREKENNSEYAREIIGFGSGVGVHGESNYTVSTEQSNFSDIVHRIESSIRNLCPGWKKEEYGLAARNLVNESGELSGMSLVRATGRSEYIRDFMAYTLTRKLFRREEKSLCDQLISLDAYMHWFDNAESKVHPDLLWIVANINEAGRLVIKLKLIECKLALQSDLHITKARQQIENGARHLVNVFMPKPDDSSDSDTERPAQRYWWIQLYRLVASQMAISHENESQVLSALESLSEGKFEVEWSGAILGYWVDSHSELIKPEDTWRTIGEDIPVSEYYIGIENIKKLCLDKSVESKWDNSAQVYGKPAKGKDEQEQNMTSLSGEDTKSPRRRVPILKSEREERTGNPQERDDNSVDIPEAQSMPDRILLGTSTQGNRQVYWEFGHKKLQNRHMVIFGTSGMGKTYAIECILSELAHAKQNSVILDYTSGFKADQIEKAADQMLAPRQHYIYNEPLPINPLRQQWTQIGGKSQKEKISITAQRVRDVFSSIYNFGDQQQSVLYNALKNGLESMESNMTLENLLHSLNNDDPIAKSIHSKLQPFIEQEPFGFDEESGWDDWYSDPNYRCHIVQMDGCTPVFSRLVTEFGLLDLYWYYRNRGLKNKPKIIVLDEIQNLNHRSGSPVCQLLTEGRKFGIGLIMATQIMSNLKKDERDRIFNAGHKLFFKPVDTEISTYADLISNIAGGKQDVWRQKLSALKKGECYSIGPSLNTSTGEIEEKPFKIKIAPLEKRDCYE